MSALTAILSLIKHVDSDLVRAGETTDASANMDAIDALFHATTGHLHTGAGTNGPKIANAALAADVRPCCIATHGVAQAIGHATPTFLWFNTSVSDATGMHPLAGGGDKIIIATPGIYQIAILETWAQNATGRRNMAIYKNLGKLLEQDYQPLSTGVDTAMGMTFPAILAADDYLRVNVYQESGVALDIRLGAAANLFSVVRIG